LYNDGDGPLVYYAISIDEPFEVCEYPDSGKVMSYGTLNGERIKQIFRHADQVDYMDGEPS
jgi:uncharacterized cupin superfamily protein